MAVAVTVTCALGRSGAAGAQPADVPEEVAPPEDALEAMRRELRRQAEEIEALKAMAEAQMSGDAAVREEPVLRIFGYADMGANKVWVQPESELNVIAQSPATTFVLGNLNLYFDAQPLPNWGLLAEVRLTNYPNGQDTVGDPFTPYQRTSTRINDVNHPTGGWSFARWGSIILERAYIEWKPSDLLHVRVGSFLTPFGIWNIDHGTPTLIALMLPQFEIQEFFPSRQIGLEALGVKQAGRWDLGYFAYISNGRTPGELDVTEDKMVGGRLFARRTRPHRLALGASAFWGRFVDEARTITQFKPVVVEREARVAYDEWAVGVDLSVDVGRLRLRSEATYHDVTYDEGKHEPGVRPGTTLASRGDKDVYLLVAYMLPWGGLEPYLFYDHFRSPSTISEGFNCYSLGLNVHFAPGVQLKLQHYYQQLHEPNGDTPEDGTHVTVGRLVLAF